jgi:hypothetical protein
MYTDGDFYLIRDQNTHYHMLPFHHTSSSGLYYDTDVVGSSSQTTLTAVSNLIQAAYPQQYANFSATLCYIFTWVLSESIMNSPTTLYQVVLSMENTTSFMIVSYVQLSLPADSTFFYQDTNGQSIPINGSTTGSNCGVPGQFVFQFNHLTSKYNLNNTRLLYNT